MVRKLLEQTWRGRPGPEQEPGNRGLGKLGLGCCEVQEVCSGRGLKDHLPNPPVLQKETDAQKGKGTCPRGHKGLMVEASSKDPGKVKDTPVKQGT